MSEQAEELPPRRRDTDRWLVSRHAAGEALPLPLLSQPDELGADNKNQQANRLRSKVATDI